MKKKSTKGPTHRLPKRDPEAAYVREVTAARRVGRQKCACGEDRPEALKAIVTCGSCQAKAEGRATVEDHHFAGKANAPTTISVPVNDHRAELTNAQLDWPRQTRENPDGSPLLAAAGRVRGFIDTVVYLIEKGLMWVAATLEAIDAALVQRHGPQWWLTIGVPVPTPTK